MDGELGSGRSHWCIVVADDHAPEWVPYGCLGGSATLLRQALHRAASIAPISQIIVTALEEYRDRWEPILWSVRPEMRVIGDKRTSPLLISAAAILSIARVCHRASRRFYQRVVTSRTKGLCAKR